MSNFSSSANGSAIDFAVNDNAPTNPCAESNVDEITSTAGRAKIKFAQGGSVGIIDEEGLLAQPFLNYVSQQNITQPREVRRAEQDACFRIGDASSSHPYGVDIRNRDSGL